MNDCDQYYVQDSRSYVGNDMLWWVQDGRGYTTDISKAHVYTKAEAWKLHVDRHSDVPWPKPYIDARIKPVVDMQYVDCSVALRGTGIKILKHKKPRHDIQCPGCGRFMTLEDTYTKRCDHCGADASP